KLGRVAVCNAAEFESQYMAYLRTMPPSSDTEPHGRAKALASAASLLRSRRREFAAMLIVHLGKTWRDADGDVAAAVDALEYYGRLILRLTERPRRRDIPGETNEYAYTERGFVAAFTGAGGGLSGPAKMLAAALAAGNSVIWKPEIATAGIAYAFAQLI